MQKKKKKKKKNTFFLNIKHLHFFKLCCYFVLLISTLFLFVLKGDLNINMFSSNDNWCISPLQFIVNHFSRQHSINDKFSKFETENKNGGPDSCMPTFIQYFWKSWCNNFEEKNGWVILESVLAKCEFSTKTITQHFRIFINIFHTAKNHKKSLYFTRKSAANIFPQKPKICTIGALSPSKKLRKIE